MNSLEIVHSSPSEPDATNLIHELDQDLRVRYPDSAIYGIEPGQLEERGAFLIARVDGTPAGCGALRPLTETVAEIKRMFTLPAFRRRGISGQLLAELERVAARNRFEALWLETGIRQPEAMALYERNGYRPMPAFGEYAADPLCRCYEKSLIARG